MLIVALSPFSLSNRRVRPRKTHTAPRPYILPRSTPSSIARDNEPRPAWSLAASACSSASTSTVFPLGTMPTLTSKQVHIHRRAKAAQSNGRPWDALALLHLHLPSYPHDTHLISLAVSLEAKLGINLGLGSKASLISRSQHLSLLIAP